MLLELVDELCISACVDDSMSHSFYEQINNRKRTIIDVELLAVDQILGAEGWPARERGPRKGRGNRGKGIKSGIMSVLLDHVISEIKRSRLKLKLVHGGTIYDSGPP